MIVNVSPEIAVVIPVPPDTVRVSVVVLAVVEPESLDTDAHKFCDAGGAAQVT